MTDPSGSSRWSQVDDLFHQAIAMRDADRDAFLSRECADDEALRAEVRSLVAAHVRAGDFIEQPAVDRRANADEGPSLAGRTLGPYTVLHEIGRGGMGVVYLARDARLDRIVAIKALAPRFTRDERQRERLRREARLAAGLSHPGIATIHALEELDGHLLIVSEHIEGRTLREEIAGGALSPADAVATMLAIAQALAAAHARGILHRDLKPENVMRTRAGHIKILDFGLARMAETAPDATLAPRLTESGVLLGTPAYMSPEQLRGQPADARADVFAWGVMAYELASGRHPFAGMDAGAVIVGILEQEPLPLLRLQPALPAAFAGLVHRCLAKDAAARPASALALVGALAGSARAGDIITPVDSPGLVAPPPLLWWWRFHQLVASFAYCLTLVPLWLTRPWMPPQCGSLVFAAGIATVLSATTLRLHLWFTSRVYPHEWAAQRERTAGWIRVADLCFVALLGLSGLSMLGDHDSAASMFIAIGVAALLASTIIEPATTRAAFRE